jgi:dTDP-4-dehydrorhamnose reductase
MKKILILGATGMLGRTLFSFFHHHSDCDVRGTVRDLSRCVSMTTEQRTSIIDGVDAFSPDTWASAIAWQPDVVINCIGIVKQSDAMQDPIQAITVNTLLPHQWAALCQKQGARFIHFSTDCVFLGTQGLYAEKDLTDAVDLYGRSKAMGEPKGDHVVTLRTSIIGHECGRRQGLIDWFLSQKGSVKGFDKAIFSGFPTIEIASILCDYVLPYEDLSGTFHVASEPINKFDLLTLVAKLYDHDIMIQRDSQLVLDRSLSGNCFSETTGYKPPVWQSLVSKMYQHYLEHHYV